MADEDAYDGAAPPAAPSLGGAGDPMDAEIGGGGGGGGPPTPPPQKSGGAAAAHAAHAAPLPAAAGAAWALRSVVKVFVARIDPNYGLPWQKSPQRTATGSGFVVDVAAFRGVGEDEVAEAALLREAGAGAGAGGGGGEGAALSLTQGEQEAGRGAGGAPGEGAAAASAVSAAAAVFAAASAQKGNNNGNNANPPARLMILTNAHVVNNAVTVYVRRPGSAKKWKAHVACAARQCDLALLSVADAAFWGGEGGDGAAAAGARAAALAASAAAQAGAAGGGGNGAAGAPAALAAGAAGGGGNGAAAPSLAPAPAPPAPPAPPASSSSLLPPLRALHFAARVPHVQEALVVAGYPTGGDALSLTSGIVSRVAMVRYSAYGRLIGVQS